MDNRIAAIYCLVDDMMKALHHREDSQAHMADAEVMTTAIMAILDFGGNLEKGRRMLAAETYIPTMLR